MFDRGRREDASPGAPAVGDLDAGLVLGKYRIVRHLGTGGMGSVYEAVHVEIGKSVALKQLSRDLAADPRARTRFLREALAASRLMHPHVVNVTDVGAEGDLPFMVMELLRGEELAELIARHPRGMPVEEAVDILLPVSAGVFAAHQAGIVHRDLKPRNIFLARNQVKEVEPKVLDFGISKVDGGNTGTSLTDSGALLGTVPYMSPEHVRGGSVPDARSDQYALGVVLFECLTGRHPHDGHTAYALLQNIAEGRFLAPSSLRPDLTPEIESRLLRAMANQPQDRFRSVHEFGRALLPFASARARVIWEHYFGAAEDDPRVATRTVMRPSPTPTRMPVAAGAATPPRGAQGPAGQATRYHEPARAALDLSTTQDARREIHAVTRSGSLPRPSRRSRLGLVLVLAASFAGVAYLRARGWPDPRELLLSLGSQDTTETTAETTTRAPAPAAAPIAPEPQTPAPPALPKPTSGTAIVAVARESRRPSPFSPPRETPAPPATEVAVRLTGAPSGLTVQLDGVETTLPLRLPRGNSPRTLTLTAPGYKPSIRTVVPSADQDLAVELDMIGVDTKSISPEPSPAIPRPTLPAQPTPDRDRSSAAASAKSIEIDVISKPPGATFWIEGQPGLRGSTPRRIKLPAGRKVVRIQARLPGYSSYEERFMPTDGGVFYLELKRPLKIVRPRRIQPSVPEETPAEFEEKLTD